MCVCVCEGWGAEAGGAAGARGLWLAELLVEAKVRHGARTVHESYDYVQLPG